MPAALRDILLSFCPEAIRKTHRPESTLFTLRASACTGLLQFLLMGYIALHRYIELLAARSRLLAPHLQGQSEAVQSGAAIMITLEFFFHPFSILALYLALEGFIRFICALITHEIIPSLPVVAVFSLREVIARKREIRRSERLPPDRVEVLAGDRLRIATAKQKPAWNASMTIGFGGTWYEVEAEEQGAGQRRFVYILRRAPPSKILRGYEDYGVPSVVACGDSKGSTPV